MDVPSEGSGSKDVFRKSSITAEAAQAMVKAAADKARQIGVPMVIAVVDESGILKAFLRMDGAKLLSVDIAVDKAWTAASFGIPTDQWYEIMKGDEPLMHGITKVPRVIVFGGGYPIVVDGEVIGGIGCSGGHYDQDMECARAGLAALEEGGGQRP